MAAWYEKLDSAFNGLTHSVGKPIGAGRSRGVDRLFGTMLDRLYDPDGLPDARADTGDADPQRAVGPGQIAAGGRPALAAFDKPRNYGAVTAEEGDDPYENMSDADHELDYDE